MLSGGLWAVACTKQEKENTKMSNNKTNNKIKANKETAEALAEKQIEAVSVHAEPTRPDWDRVITPKADAKDDVVFDFDRGNVKGCAVDGVRYAKIDDHGRVMQIRVAEATTDRHWWTVKDAIDAGILSDDFAAWTGHMAEYDAKIARVEVMEKLGMDIPNGVALAYAQGVKNKKDAIKAREEKENAIVLGGKDAYVKDASVKAGTRFDKIETRVKARAVPAK